MTLQAIVWPTRPGGRAQTIMSLWNPDAGQGVRLDINARASWRRCWRKAGGRDRGQRAMLAREWYSVALSIDAEEGVLTLHQVPHRVYARVDDRARAQRRQSAPALDGQTLLASPRRPRRQAAASSERR